jgi:hypothetical protein
MGRRLAVLVAAAAVGAVAAPHASACTLWASSKGNDRASGEARAPFKTVHRLLAALPGGSVGCLVGGSTFRERVWITRPVTLTTTGRSVTVVGGIVIAHSAPGTTVRGLAVRGGGRGRAAIDVRANGTRIAGNDVSGPGFRDRSNACILLEGVRRVVVDGNRLHNCTRASRRNLYAPGVLVRSASGSTVSNNVVYHTLGDGISLGPNAQRTRVHRNIVDGNTNGIFIGGSGSTASSNNVVTQNIVSNSGGWNVHAQWGSAVGRGNVVTSNCLWHGFGGNYGGTGYSHGGNVVASPRYRKRPTDFTLTGGPCVAMHPSIVRAHLPTLPRFSVAYRLRALPKRVQVVSLTLTGLTPRSKVSVQCTARCGTRWVGRPPRSTFALPVLRGAWLARGATILVREQVDGWQGHVARITVTGLPGGVRIDHWNA